MSEELKPCPFCGGNAVLTGIESKYYISCDNCPNLMGYAEWDNKSGHQGLFKTETEAIKYWNSRT